MIFALRVLTTAIAAFLLTLAADTAWSQGKRTIKVIVPFAAGGGADILARLLADKITSIEPVAMIIEDRAGAGTVIGTEAVARAAPDGNTVLIVTDSFLTVPHLRKVNYDPITSFEPVCELAATPQVIVVNATSPFRTLPDLINAAREKPGALNLASPGPGGSAHVTIEMLKRAANMNVVYVPYPGVTPALTALMGDHITAAFSTLAAVAEHLRSGKLRALAVASGKRLPSMPELPTVIEYGYPDIDADLWYGLYAPAKTPAATVAQLGAWFGGAVKAPELQDKLAVQGLLPVAMCGPEFGSYVRRQFEKYGRGIRDANIKAE